TALADRRRAFILLAAAMLFGSTSPCNPPHRGLATGVQLVPPGAMSVPPRPVSRTSSRLHLAGARAQRSRSVGSLLHGSEPTGHSLRSVRVRDIMFRRPYRRRSQSRRLSAARRAGCKRAPEPARERASERP